MKKIKRFKMGDEIPADAKFVYAEKIGSRSMIRTRLYFYYEIENIELEDRKDNSK